MLWNGRVDGPKVPVKSLLNPEASLHLLEHIVGSLEWDLGDICIYGLQRCLNRRPCVQGDESAFVGGSLGMADRPMGVVEDSMTVR